MTKQLAFYVDTSVCAKCKACQIACQDKNNLPAHMRWRRVLPYEGGTWIPDPSRNNLLRPSGVFSYSISISCMHCQNPICVEVCPAGAIIKRDDGVVYIDQDRCIGCRYCEWACPYGGVHFDEEVGTMSKCDFCRDLLDKGGNPACVDACVMRALKFGDLEDLRAEYGDLAEIAPLPSADLTNPSIVLKPHKDAQPSDQGSGKIKQLPEEM
jgi:anaerobic dimethyl sulfoxide reductase subunit B (iron-sulfur subunit)